MCINSSVAPRIMNQFLIMSRDFEVTPDEPFSQAFTDDVPDYLSDGLYDTPVASVPVSSCRPAGSASTTSGTFLESRPCPTFIIVTEANKDSIKSLLAVSNPSQRLLISRLDKRTLPGHLKAKFHGNLTGRNFMKF